MTKELKEIVLDDISECNKYLNINSTEETDAFFDKIESKYFGIIEKFSAGTISNFDEDFNLSLKNIKFNLTILKEKMELFVAMGCKNLYSNKNQPNVQINNSNSNSNVIDINISFEQARKNIEVMTALSESEIADILSKVDELEKIENSKLFDSYKQSLIECPGDLELCRFIVEMAYIIKKIGENDDYILSGRNYYGSNNNDKNYEDKDQFINNIPIFIPNFFDMSFEEILELKSHMHDELLEMQSYINEIPYMFSDINLSSEDANLFIKHKINPSIKQLENKYYGLKTGLLRQMLKELKNPLSYSPLISTIFTNVPSSVAVLGSLGIIVGDSYLEYKMAKKELDANSLYFAVKINKYLN